MDKKILTVQDISCVGQCSLTVALPILSACGIETAILPSAVLSTHTGGFSGWTFRDLTDDIPGIVDQFFVNIPDPLHDGFVVPYLYVVLENGVTVESIRREVAASLKPHMVPYQIVQLPERPFWHFKTNRIGLTNEVMAARQAHCMAV